MGRYKLSKSTIHRVLAYDVPERARPGRTGRPQQLTDAKVNEVIEYCAENWEQWTMDYEALVKELGLDYKASTLQKRRLPKALPHRRAGSWTITLGDHTHILARGVVKGTLVGRGYILSRRKDGKGESDKEQVGKDAPNLYTTPVSPWRYGASQRVGSD
jgi:hypothetical protein